MAAVYQKENGKYRVIYDNPNGIGRNQRQKTFNSKKEAEKFLREVEYKRDQNKLITPKSRTVEDFFNEWVALYAKANWQGKTYDTNLGILKNHIIPVLGKMELNKVCPLDIERFINSLRSKKISGFKAKYKGKNDELPCLSPTTIRYIFVILRQAFEKAVEWKQIDSNPVISDAPKRKPPKNKIVWNFDDWYSALENIQNELLRLAVNLAFTCSLRPGEVVGLTWDCIDIEGKRITINKTLQRFSNEAMAELPGDEILRVFPEKTEMSNSRLVLKIPKTVQSERYIFITEHLSSALTARKVIVEKQKQYLGDQYLDYDLVFCLENGDPTETHLVEKWFKKWLGKCTLDIPHILFRELRHSSTTYKLKESDGDYKSVIGDTGHASADMVIKVYGQIVDKNRQELTGKLEERLNQKEMEAKIPTAQNEGQAGSEVSDLLKMIKQLKESDPNLQKKLLQVLLT